MEDRQTTERPPRAEEDAGRGVAVRLSGITKRFGDFVAVDDLNLDIYEGEFFSLLGPSGCGKTTTLRMIAGFEEPTQGEISVAGEQVQGTQRLVEEEHLRAVDEGAGERYPLLLAAGEHAGLALLEAG